MPSRNVDLFVRAVLEGPPDQILARVGDSQCDIAMSLGVSQGTVSDWLSGRYTVPKVIRYLILAREGVIRMGRGRWVRLGRRYGLKPTGFRYVAMVASGEIQPTPGGGRKKPKGKGETR